jgi:hypothetical protein
MEMRFSPTVQMMISCRRVKELQACKAFTAVINNFFISKKLALLKEKEI